MRTILWSPAPRNEDADDDQVDNDDQGEDN